MHEDEEEIGSRRRLVDLEAVTPYQWVETEMPPSYDDGTRAPAPLFPLKKRPLEERDPGAPRLTLRELREKVGALAPMERAREWSVPGADVSLPSGSIVELLGGAQPEWLMRFFREHPEAAIAWCEPRLTLYPPAVAQRGVELARFLFVETEKELVSSLHQIVRSGHFPFVVASAQAVIPERQADVFLRRMQIGLEKSGSTLFFLSERPTASFGIQFQIETGSTGETRLLKNKRGG